MSEISDRLLNVIQAADLSYGELSKITGHSKSALQRYATGETKKIPVDVIIAVASAAGVEAKDIMGWNDAPQENDKSIERIKNNNAEKTVPVPIVGEVAAGAGSYADINNSIIDYFDIPESWVKGDENYVLLKVSGDSMLPEFMEDDLVLIRCQTSVDSGDFAVAIIDDENGVIKRVRYGKDWIELQSLNPIYAPRYFEDKEVLRVRIFGLVRKIIRDYK